MSYSCYGAASMVYYFVGTDEYCIEEPAKKISTYAQIWAIWLFFVFYDVDPRHRERGNVGRCLTTGYCGGGKEKGAEDVLLCARSLKYYDVCGFSIFLLLPVPNFTNC